MATVVPAEGVILERVLEAAHSISLEGLSREAHTKFDAAQMKTAWGRHHQTTLCAGGWRRRACERHATTLRRSSMNGRCACAESARCSPSPRIALAAMRELVERLLDEAARDGAAMALSFQT